jgi:hypothetical protein
MNIVYDERKITWEFEGKKYKYFVEGIRRADIEKKYIFVHSCSSNCWTYTYITLNGILILSISTNFDNHSKSVKILNEKGEQASLAIPKLDNITYYDNYLYAIIGDDTDRKVVKYSLHGKMLREYPQPSGYNIYRFFSLINDEKKIEFIVYGEDEETLQYSWKNTWKFTLNSETGEWKKICYVRD